MLRSSYFVSYLLHVRAMPDGDDLVAGADQPVEVAELVVARRPRFAGDDAGIVQDEGHRPCVSLWN